MKYAAKLSLNAKGILTKVGIPSDTACVVDVEYDQFRDLIVITVKSSEEVDGVTGEFPHGMFLSKNTKVDI